MGFKQEILKRIEKATDLPTLPGVFVKLDKMISNSNTSASQVAEVMKDDISLTARVLKVANSAAFAGTKKITSVSAAIARLGFSQMSNITRSLSVMGKFQSKGVIDLKKFWRHSLSVAYTMDLIPRYLDRSPKESAELFTAGLLHDVGIFAMVQYTGDLYASVIATAAATEQPLHMAEHDVMQTNHAEVGSVMLARWNIPGTIGDAIKHHHDNIVPSEGAISTADVIKMANYICNFYGIDHGLQAKAPPATDSDLVRLGFKVNMIKPMREEVEALVGKSVVMVAIATDN